MQKETTPFDISDIPDLLRIAEEVQTSKVPRLLKHGNKAVAILAPIGPATLTPNPQLRDLANRLAGSLAEVDIPGWETSEAAEHWVEELRQADTFPLEPSTHP
jgi:hypothetical protein